MQISKVSLVVCALALGVTLTIRAEDNAAQATARAALASKLFELNEQPPATNAAVVAPAAKPEKPAPAPKPKPAPKVKPAPAPVVKPTPAPAVKSAPAPAPVEEPVMIPVNGDAKAKAKAEKAAADARAKEASQAAADLKAQKEADKKAAAQKQAEEAAAKAQAKAKAKADKIAADAKAKTDAEAAAAELKAKKEAAKKAAAQVAVDEAAAKAKAKEELKAQKAAEKKAAEQKAAEVAAAKKQVKVSTQPAQPAKPAPPVIVDTPAQAKAREALARSLMEMSASEPVPVQTPVVAEPAKPVAAPKEIKDEEPAPVVKPAEQPKVVQSALAPVTAPALPIPQTKEQKLQELLAKYKADQITPAEYHKQRAAILAEP